MILPIKYLFIPILSILFFCKDGKAIELRTNKELEITKPEPVQNESKNFVFYKAFSFCNSEVGYFTDEEAGDLYAEKSITLALEKGKIEDISTVYPAEKLKCISEFLNLKEKIEMKVFETQDSFPFDNIKLLNDQYLITARDGYYFVFTEKKGVNGVLKTDQNKKITLQYFKSLLDHKIVGLSIIKDKEENIYKKYGLDFSTLCYCNSPSMYINTKSKELIIFNYCDSKKSISTIENKTVYKNINLDIEVDRLVIKTEAKLKIIFSKKDTNHQIFNIEVEGNFPTRYVGGDLKEMFTSEPEKFKKTDCGDFDG